MEEHKFKLCFKSLPNGRSFGSHMKSDTLDLQQSESASYSSSEGEEKGQFYGEDPKRSEIEWSESSKNPTRKRSKRARRTLEQQEETKKLKANNNKQPSRIESWGVEPELLSSISDVAFCLMMLSRDQWKSKVHQHDYLDDDDDETDESEFTTTLARGKYICETCNKIFDSYQALGGHRASHKRIKPYETDQLVPEIVATCSLSRKKTRSHECPVCFRVFSSGQALGGHKRSHVTGTQVAATTQTCVRIPKMLVLDLIDLNLPAPVDENDDERRCLI